MEEPLGVSVNGRDTFAFSVHTGEERVLLAELAGRYLFTPVATGFTERVIGIDITKGTAAFD